MTAKQKLRDYVVWLESQLKEYPGVIVQSRSSSRLGVKIRKVLKRFSNHTAIGCGSVMRPRIGDAHHPRATWTDWDHYRARILAGERMIRLCLPMGYTEERGRQAVLLWEQEILGKPYDWFALKGLLLHIKLWIPWVRHWRWAWFCTEGVAHVWDKVLRVRVFGKKPHRATPGTVDKRMAEGRLRELRPEWAATLTTEEWEAELLQMMRAAG